MNMDSVSIIIPAYNVEETIERCLNSVMFQTVQPKEIIVINDGSTDNTGKIVNKYKNLFNTIKVVNQENFGLAAARNVGLNQATGNYILFVDSDDEIMPNTIEKCLKNFDKDTNTVWFKTIVECNYDDILKNNMDKYMNSGPCGKILITDEMLSTLNVPAWSKMFKRKDFIDYNIKFPFGMYNEDEVLHYNFFSLHRKANMIEDKLYVYHLRKGSIMDKVRKKTEGMRVYLIWNLNFIYDFWVKNGILTNRELFFEKIVERFTKSAIYGSQDYEVARCIWEITKLLRKWNLPYKSDYLKTLYEGKMFDNIWNIQDFSKKINQNISIMSSKIAEQSIQISSIVKEQEKNLTTIQQQENKIAELTNDKNRHLATIQQQENKIAELTNDKNCHLATIQQQKYKMTTQKYDILKLNKKVDILKKSSSYKIGRFFTYIPRTIKRIKNKIKQNKIQKSYYCDEKVINSLKSIEPFYFIPNKGNWGDVVIAACEMKLFDIYNIKYNTISEQEATCIDKPFNLVYGGGGIWTRDYLDSIVTISNIFKMSNLRKCIILPSSFYKIDSVVGQFDERFIIFCREYQSYARVPE